MAVALPTDWRAVEDAVQLWFNTTTELTTVWADQTAPQPSYPYATLNIIAGPTREGGLDEERQTDFDGGAAAGEELGFEIIGYRLFTLSCQIRVAPPDATDPDKNALTLMAAAQSSLGLRSVRDTFKVDDIAVVNEGDILDISEAINESFISIAGLDVQFRAVSTLTERTAAIETVEVSSTFAPSVSASLELDDESIPPP